VSRLIHSRTLAVLAVAYILWGFPIVGSLAARADNLVGALVLYLVLLGALAFWAYFLDRNGDLVARWLGGGKR